MNLAAGALESTLVLRAQAQQDDRAFSRLITMHQSKVRGFLLRLTQNGANADDLAQEVFLIAYRKLGTYTGKGEFGGWLCSIAYRCFLQHYRKQKREREIHQQLANTGDDGGEKFESQYFENINTAQIALEKAIRHLNQDQAASITLCESYGYSHSEAAAILDMPLGTVKSHVNRGKQKLRELLIDSRKELQA